MSSNNLGRTETSVNQDNKEATLNGSDAILDGAISDALDVNYSGDVTMTVSDAQLQQHVAFRLKGTPGASPVFKLAAIQRGLIVVYNQTGVNITCKDYTTLTSYVVPAGGTVVLYVQEDAIAGITAAGALADAPADGTVYGRKNNAWEAVVSAYGSEDARDDIAAMIAAGVHEGISIIYDDAGNAISFKVTGNSDYQESVVIASLTNLTLSGTYTTQSVALQVGDRVLAAGQTAAEDRRIWVVAPGAWTIADGWDVADTITSGTIVPVDRGTYGGQIFQLLTPDPITLGVSSLSWQSNVAASVSNFTIIAATGSSFTPTAAQKRHQFNLDTAGTQQFNVPTHTSVGVAVGAEWLVSARTTGTKTVKAASGVTINGVNGATLSFGSQYDMWWLKKRANNDWQAWPLVLAAGSSYTDEAAQDAIAAAIAAGTHTGITITYTDGSNKFDFVVSGTGALDTIGTTRGSVLYRGASGWSILTPGTSGYVLQSNGAGADPTWAAVAAGYTDENAMDAIAALFAAGTHDGVSFSYNDGGDALSVTAKPTESIIIAASDESTALTTGTGKVTFRMPYAFTLTGIKGSLTTAQTSGSTLTVDVNKGGTTIMSSAKITFDNTEKTTATATTAPALTTTSLADDDEITIDIDAVGDGTAKGLKVYLIGHRT